MNTYLLIGLIVGGFFVVLTYALCKMSARCSPAEQAAMDDEQVEAMQDWKLKRISANEKWQARWKDGNPPGIGKGW